VFASNNSSGPRDVFLTPESKRNAADHTQLHTQCPRPQFEKYHPPAPGKNEERQPDETIKQRR
jgi:hypothetical protein